MLLPELNTINEYVSMLVAAGFRIVETLDISRQVSKTWDLCLKLREVPGVMRIAVEHGSDFVSFLRGFDAMRQGFRSGAFRCGMIVAEKDHV